MGPREPIDRITADEVAREVYGCVEAGVRRDRPELPELLWAYRGIARCLIYTD
jgi:hypothetical protein